MFTRAYEKVLTQLDFAISINPRKGGGLRLDAKHVQWVTRSNQVVTARDFVVTTWRPRVLGALKAANTDLLIKNFKLVTLASYTKNEVLLAQDATHPVNVAPACPPPSVILALQDLCGLDAHTVQLVWDSTKDLIWNLAGPVPVYSVQLVCKDNNRSLAQGCNTTYHLDYCEKKNSVMKKQEQRYYNEEPDIIQIGEHQFAETRLVQKWKYDMNLAHVSAGDCAASYKLSFLKESKLFPKSWQFGVTLSGAQVLDAFTLLSLLQHCQRIGPTLVLLQDGYQANRFTDAIHNRNEYIRQFGTPLLTTGALNVFGYILLWQNEEYHYLGKLANSKMMFCNKHKDREGECAIKECKTQADSGWKTCNILLHHATDELRKKRVEGSHFPWKGQLERARAAHPKEGICAAVEDQDNVDKTLPEATVDDRGTKGEEVDHEGDEVASEEYIIVDAESVRPAPAGPAPTQAQQAADTVGQAAEKPVPVAPVPLNQIRVQFGRQRTHNEQILATSCGIILGWDTMITTESMPACAEFVKPICGKRKCGMPQHLIYDNNCSFSKHIVDDPVFAETGLAVNVFHFDWENGKGWWFNTSICEQINVWLGGFHSMVQEMYEDRLYSHKNT
ncbi:hypothetical protein BKA70DRAFT_1243788 [Coprinopsis sp. MPI-PUGE-AT-0042]|nr:hypothetical protein BKA70DRAFT_1243788 [Coprinopsis sp. MPI-PUGE-AT-0042]